MDAVDDELNDYKLETQFHLNPPEPHVVHTSYQRDSRHGGRKYKVETTWHRVKELGVGSFSVVHLEATADGQERAVKSIPKSLMTFYRVDYRRELAALAVFSKSKYQQHQIFVDFLGWYDNLDHVFIALEYFPLGDLGKYIPYDFKNADVQDIANQLFEGLKIMHQKGYTHRDLKPQNIFVVQITPAWWIKIGDFGIAKRVTSYNNTELRTSTGTQGYEAPEIRGYVEVEESEETSIYTNLVDIWSAGCVIYKIVAKTVPFQDGRSISRYCRGMIVFPENPLRGKLTEDGIEFLKRLFVPQPSLRPTAEIALQDSWLLADSRSYESDDATRDNANDQKEGKDTADTFNQEKNLELGIGSSALTSISPEKSSGKEREYALHLTVMQLLDNMTPVNSEEVVDKLIVVALYSKDETNARSLRLVIGLTFMKAIRQGDWATLYVQFFKHLFESMTPDIKDESFLDRNGNAVSGGALFRKYLLNQCQEAWETGKVGRQDYMQQPGDGAVATENIRVGLAVLIGHLFLAGFVTERIIHECTRQSLDVDYTDVPDTTAIESAAVVRALLEVTGQSLTMSEYGGPMISAYFERIAWILEIANLPPECRDLLAGLVEL